VSYCNRNNVSLNDQQQQDLDVEATIENNKNDCIPCNAIFDILVQPVDTKMALQS
jgi:hypothetical protein